MHNPPPVDVEDETKRRQKDNEAFFGRQFQKMYSNNQAPDYLVEDQPGELKVPCKPLLQKVKEDTSSCGLTGNQCLLEAERFFNEQRKKVEAAQRKRDEREMKAELKQMQLEKRIGERTTLIKGKNTVKLKDQMSAARATSAGRSTIMRTPDSTELIMEKDTNPPTDQSKVLQSPKRYLDRISPKKQRNPNKATNLLLDSEIGSM